MSIAQQVNIFLEDLPVTEQVFFLELVKRWSSGNDKKTIPMTTSGNVKSLFDFIQACEADPLSDESVDEMLITDRVNITREFNI